MNVSQLPVNNALALSATPSSTPERPLAGTQSGGQPAQSRTGANSRVNAVQDEQGAAPGKDARRAKLTDFVQTLKLQLREQLDPALGQGVPATPPVKGLPAGGKGSPLPLPLDPDAPASEAELVVVSGLMPLPVQPQVATDAKLDAGLQSKPGPGQESELLVSANGTGRSAPRGLLAMLERQAGENASADKGDAAALRTFAATIATTGNPIDSTSFTNGATPSSGFRDQSVTSAPARAVVEGAPPAPNAASALPAAAPSESLRVATSVAHLEQPVGTSAWRDAVGHQVTWMVEQQVSRAELRLHPAHLGPIEVSISVNNDEVNVSFQASHPATREALESSLPRLRELLGDSGLSLGQASVSQQFAGGQRTPERAPSSEHGTTSPFEERATPFDAPITTRVRVGLLDAYA
jgi:flagellar hook-length control protein FliK